MRFATICANSPESARTSSPSALTYCCICMWRVPWHWCRWISPAKVCTGPGYRSEGGRAPLKENGSCRAVARGVGADCRAGRHAALDPMCGSGTFLTEGALIAADAAPALDREYFDLNRHGHDAALWARLRAGAGAGEAGGEALHLGLRHRLRGGPYGDCHHAAHAGVADWLLVEKRALSEVPCPEGDTGLVVANCSYGVRIGAESGCPSWARKSGAECCAIAFKVGRRLFSQAIPRWPAIWDLRQAHAPGIQWHHRVPAAALRFERGERAASC